MEEFKYFLDGPGETLVVATDFDPTEPDPSKIFAVVTAKTAAIRGTLTEEKVTGGRSLAPRRKFPTDREVTFELSDCEMDFRYVSLTQGEDIVTGSTVSWAFGEDEQFTIPSTAPYTVDLNNIPLVDTLVIIGHEDGAIFDEATVAEGKYSVDGSTVTFDEADKGKTIKAIYKFDTPETTKQVSTYGTSIPKTVTLVHRHFRYDENNVLLGYQEVEIYNAAISGEFEQAYEERAAFAPTLNFELLDPKRADRKIMDQRYIVSSSAVS